ncbi:hypothetical protein [Bradyrhizobium valentinum]|uniref:hypothetical protein n=1 Tax=Bradyrhizobium valentinum TaxID=1518501 RepID=UPI0007091908|nr:hypothetical protein [Bradyrhizobium valentinum]KRQ92555.1 hypothetical protein CQ10_36955 [Bradyrhizobium valentinum]
MDADDMNFVTDFFSALFGFRKSSILAPGRGWIVPVVGEVAYQEVLRYLYREKGGNGHDLKVVAVVTPEDGNEFDANAVRIDIDGRTVGYFSREMAVEYRAVLGADAGQCGAKIVGGFELEDGNIANFGVKLNLAWPPRMK